MDQPVPAPVPAPAPVPRKRARAGATGTADASAKAAVPRAPRAVVTKAPTVSPFRAWAGQAGEAAIIELCDFIVGNGAAGHLAAFVKARGFAYVTVLDWINADKRRAEMYTHAREDRADVLADEIVAISDEDVSMLRPAKRPAARKDGEPEAEAAPAEVVLNPAAVARNRLRVDARKWAAAKLKPRVYGEKVAVGGADDMPPLQHAHLLSDEQLLAIAAGAAGAAGK